MIELIETTHDMNEKALADLETLNVGYEQCASGYGYRPTVRSYNLIHFVTKGTGYLDFEGVRYVVNPGDAFIIPADHIAYYEASVQDPWEYAWIGFLGTRADRYLGQILQVTPEHYILHNINTSRYFDVITHAADLKGTSASNYFKANAALYEIFGFLTEDLSLLTIGHHQLTIAEDVKLYLDMKYANIKYCIIIGF